MKIARLLITVCSVLAFSAISGCATESPYTKLTESIRSGDLRKADVLLGKSSDVNMCSAMMIATEDNNLPAIRHFLPMSTPSCYDSETGVTLLMTAASNGYVEAAQMFIKAGAALNTRSDKGWTASDYAASRQHYLVWDLLRRNGGFGTLSADQLSAVKNKEAQKAREERAEEDRESARKCARAKEQQDEACHPGNEIACAAMKSFAISDCD